MQTALARLLPAASTADRNPRLGKAEPPLTPPSSHFAPGPVAFIFLKPPALTPTPTNQAGTVMTPILLRGKLRLREPRGWPGGEWRRWERTPTRAPRTGSPLKGPVFPGNRRHPHCLRGTFDSCCPPTGL